MTCDECERILLDSKSGPSVSVLALAESHAQNCAACASKSSDLARLHAAFDELRASTEQMEAPGRVEGRLLAAFRQATPQRSALAGRANSWRPVWALVAALLLLASGLALYTTLKPKSGKMVERRSVQPENKAPMQQPSPLLSGHRAPADVPEGGHAGANQKRPLRPAVKLVARGNPAHRPTTPQVRVPADQQLSLNGGSNVIRVTLPLSSLAAVGVPMYPDLPDRQVTADVAMDPFGAIIAIRLVGTKPQEGLAN